MTGAGLIESDAIRISHASIARAEAARVARMASVKFDRSQMPPSAFPSYKSATCMTLTFSREIERLGARIRDLEKKLKDQTNSSSIPLPPTSTAASPPSNLDPMEEYKGNKRRCEGTWSTNHSASQRQLYGPSSSFYFMTRLGSYIGLALQQPQCDHHIQPKVASMFFASPTSPRMDGSEESPLLTEARTAGGNLSHAQEKYFLGLFWQTYHCTIPIMEESQFREHYESLWVKHSLDGPSRKSSPLVEIVLALCMQYGIAFVPRNDPSKASVDSDDSSIAGRGFFYRCQTLLAYESESPSISTLQCHIFSAIYLCNASFLNMAHSTLAVAIRTAYLLGLDQEPADTLSRAHKELRRRLWWMVNSLESKACMALGRPWQVQISQITCSLPADDKELALLSGSNFASTSEEITWLSYHVQCVKLILAARAVHVAFYKKCGEVLTADDGESLHSDAQYLEIVARFLSQSLQCIQTWVRDVPNALKTVRRGGGESFSTDRSPLEVDSFAPLWLQRQRLLLELLYHHCVMNLYRPFICFSPAPSSCTPLADGNAILCLNHAMASTNIIDQVLTATDILNGWHEAYQFQWDATLSMLGFCFAYPVCPPTPSARKIINSAINVFDILGNNFAVAASAANLTRDRAAKADFVIDRFRTSLSSSPLPQGSSSFTLGSAQSYSNHNNFNHNQQPSNSNDNNEDNNWEITAQAEIGEPSTMTHNALAGTMGSRFPIDSFSAFEPLWSDGNAISIDMWEELITD